MDEAYDILQTILDDPNMFKDNTNGIRLRDYISEENLYAVELNIGFFENVPKEDLSKVLEHFLELLFYYEIDLGHYNLDINRRVNKTKILLKIDKPPTRPSIQIERDINLLKAYQEMVHRLYGAENKKDGSYAFLNIPDELYQNYLNNIKIIDDLEQKKFKLVSKLKYYEMEAPSKTELRNYLKELRMKYNLKGVSLEEDQLIKKLSSKEY